MPDAAQPDAGVPPDAPVAIDTDAPPEGWYTVSEASRSVEMAPVKWQYAYGYLHGGDPNIDLGWGWGWGIRNFVDNETGEDHSGGFDAVYKNYKWDKTPVVVGTPVDRGQFVDIPVTTGLSKKIDRLYYGFAGLEIEYLENTSEWTEDFIHVAGAENDLVFVMYGMDDVVGMTEGRRLWKESERISVETYGRPKANYGDTFIEANGATVDDCSYQGHFIYGLINRTTGRGIAGVYPTSFTVQDFRIWWTEVNRIEIEFAPNGKIGKRWLFRVDGGRDQVVSLGKALVDAGRFPGN